MRDEVRTAAALTASGDTARIRLRTFLHPSDPKRQGYDSMAEGIVDFAHRRTRVQLHPAPAWEELFELIDERIGARFPWLVDEDEPDSAELQGETLYAGTARSSSFGGAWTEWREGDPDAGRRARADPAWIIDALTHAETVRELSGAAPGSSSSGRFEFRLDPGAHPDLDTRNVRRPWRLAGEASIDENGRLQAATWIALRRWRRRYPAALRSQGSMWHSIELWDFGGPPAIALPDVEPTEPLPSLAATLYDMAGYFWRRKRAYERRHGLD